MNINKKPLALPTICGPLKKRVDTRPDYQRPLVWTKSQRQLLIDTLLRGYDVPKLYWHRIAKNPDQYEVVDGQQRLHAIWDFYEDKYALPLDADPINGHSITGLRYSELPDDIRSKLDEYSLDIVVLEDADEDEARELFLRLQSGTTLRASEKRNAMSGNLRNIVRDFAQHEFFNSVGFANRRFDFDQVVAQMTLLEISQGPCEVSDKDLTQAYEGYGAFDFAHGQGKKTIDKIRRVLDFLARAFPEKTPELKKGSAVSLYWLISTLMSTHVILGLEKSLSMWFIDFERKRVEDEEKPQDERDPDMVLYHDHINQHTNSQESISFRHQVLSSAFLLAFPDLLLLDNQRDFTYEQRLAIYRKDNGICQWVGADGTTCGVRCVWSDWHADHVVAWSKGGPTTVANGQVLCPRHNLAKGADLPIVLANSTEIAKPTEILHVATDKPKAIAAGSEPRYTAVLGQLRNLGWQPEQLLGQGRTSHKLNLSGTVLAILRHAMKQQKGTSDFYFFGLSPIIFEKCSAQGKVYVFFECGSPSSVLILPGEQLRQYFEGIPTAGNANEWKINIFSNGTTWKLQPSGKPRIDVTWVQL